MISVIIPFFNTASYLRQCLESVARQRFADFEVLLIDDYSTDGSAAIASEYAARDPRFRLLKPARKGLFEARNLALSQARGEYLCFIDSDDWVTEDYLSALHADAERSGCDLVIHGALRLFPDQRDVPYVAQQGGAFDLRTGHEAFFEAYNLFGLCSVWAKLFRTSIVRQHQLIFSPQVYQCDDLYFLLSYLLHCGEVCVSSRSMNYRYVSHSQSVSTFYGSYHEEYQSFQALYQGWQPLLKAYPCSALQRSYGEFIGYYVNRIITSMLRHPSSQGVQPQLRQHLHQHLLPLYRAYFAPQTLYLKSLRFAALHQSYALYDFIMQLAVIRYRLHYNFR